MFFEWDGRIDDGAKSKRIHEVVENIHITQIKHVEDMQFALVGFACDEGVRRNKGRVGAKEAPNTIRSYLANLPYDTKSTQIVDVGNIHCAGRQLEHAQRQLGFYVATLLRNNYRPFILGGGHETLYGHYIGVRETVGKEASIGIINIDAHFDLRIDETPSSGTMFRQILEVDDRAQYLCLGIQPLGNTEQLFQTAKELGVHYLMADDVTRLDETYEMIEQFANENDYILVTLCTDVIDQAHAPGVSAPAPFGLHPQIVRSLLRYIIRLDNFTSFDISEVNPTYDMDGRTARLVSYLLGDVLHELNRHERKESVGDD